MTGLSGPRHAGAAHPDSVRAEAGWCPLTGPVPATPRTGGPYDPAFDVGRRDGRSGVGVLAAAVSPERVNELLILYPGGLVWRAHHEGGAPPPRHPHRLVARMGTAVLIIDQGLIDAAQFPRSPAWWARFMPGWVTVIPGAGNFITLACDPDRNGELAGWLALFPRLTAALVPPDEAPYGVTGATIMPGREVR